MVDLSNEHCKTPETSLWLPSTKHLSLAMTHNATTYNQIIETTALKWTTRIVFLSECYLIKWSFFSDTIQLTDGPKKQIYSDIRYRYRLSGHHYLGVNVTKNTCRGCRVNIRFNNIFINI